MKTNKTKNRFEIGFQLVPKSSLKKTGINIPSVHTAYTIIACGNLLT